jgi:hypothetical protein
LIVWPIIHGIKLMNPDPGDQVLVIPRWDLFFGILHTGVAETAAASVGFIQPVYDSDPGSINPLDHHLGDAVSPVYGIVGPAEIDQRYLDLTPVIGIDGTGCINETDSEFYSQSAAGANLGFIAWRQGHGKAGGNRKNRTGFQPHPFFKGSAYVHTGGLRGHITGERNIRVRIRP